VSAAAWDLVVVIIHRSAKADEAFIQHVTGRIYTFIHNHLKKMTTEARNG
jgi:hypothetical protein